MTYEKLIQTISEMVNNDLIYKKGLTLNYEVDKNIHRRLDEHFFYKSNDKDGAKFEPSDEFEVEMGGIIIKFIKK
jgi:hypothetical protein